MTVDTASKISSCADHSCWVKYIEIVHIYYIDFKDTQGISQGIKNGNPNDSLNIYEISRLKAVIRRSNNGRKANSNCRDHLRIAFSSPYSFHKNETMLSASCNIGIKGFIFSRIPRLIPVCPCRKFTSYRSPCS